LFLQGHDDVADVIKDDIWPDPLRWFREYEETMDRIFEGEGEDEGEVEEEGEEEGEEDYEADGEDGLEYGQGPGEFTV
jgi:template-activating factor I